MALIEPGFNCGRATGVRYQLAGGADDHLSGRQEGGVSAASTTRRGEAPTRVYNSGVSPAEIEKAATMTNLTRLALRTRQARTQ